MIDGEENNRKTVHINPPVFFISAGLIIAFAIYGSVFSDQAEKVFATLQALITDTFGWLYVGSVATFLVFVIGLAISDFGKTKLGPDDSVPDYSYTSWFAMLFSAGMGIGLMFFSVAEPVIHYLNPPVGEGSSLDAARNSMKITFFHWGIHAWAIYIVTGLSLAYFAFRHNLPLTIRSALYPLIGERIHGPIGHTVDIFAVLGTMFGVATSLGLGVLQVNAGLNYLFDLSVGLPVQISLITLITLCATGSVVAGLDNGIRRISELNLLLAAVLLIFVLATGPTVFLLNALFQNLGTYLSNIVDMTFKLYAYEPNDWISSWTLFYWGWWISWSPFVGMFIARVSRGRTIREFVVGVLLVPSGFTFMWLTVFGDTALHYAIIDQASALVHMVQDNLPVALFAMLDHLPLSDIMSLIATTLVITFFITSSDSGSLVIDIITSGGEQEPPVWQRIFWAVSEGVVAIVLLVAGGLTALQTAAIASALPFTIVMLFICYGLVRGLQISRAGVQAPEHLPALVTLGTGRPWHWQQRIHKLFTYRTREEMIEFMKMIVGPALSNAADEFREKGIQVDVSEGEEQISFTARHEGQKYFEYSVRLRGYKMPSFFFPEFTYQKTRERRYYQAEVYLNDRAQEDDITDYSKDQVIHNMLEYYERHMQLIQPASDH